MSPSKSTKEQRDFARQQLITCEITRGSLPYHKKFEELFEQYSQSGLPKLSENDYWLLLDNTGKNGGAKQPNKTKLPTVGATKEEVLQILRLIPDSPGSRDRLPYTTEFEHLYNSFTRHTERTLTRNEFWRLVLNVAKRTHKPQPIDINPSNILSASLLDDLHRMNPWWRGDRAKSVPTSKRKDYQLLFDDILNGRCQIVALRGPRQVGKTTIQQQMIHELLEKKRLVSPEHIIRIQFDDLKSLEITDPIVTIISWFEKNVVKDTFNNLAAKKKHAYIFLDEIQDVPNWSAQLKHIVDHEECRIFITGSSALRIFKGKESLAGRVHWNEMNSLSLSEISTFRNTGLLRPYVSEIDVSKLQDKKFWIDFKQWDSYKPLLLDTVYENFCDFGGYPFCHTDKTISWQKAEEELCETVVARTIDHDLKANFESEYKKKIGQMTSSLLSNVFKTFCKYSGEDVGLKKLHEELQSSFSESLTHNQIRMILDFFEHSMLIKVIKPFEHRLKPSQERVKICLCDHAIRKAWLKEDIPLYGESVNADLAGHIIEGIIGTFLASIKGIGISYFPPMGQGKDKENEIDFILEIGNSHIPVEIKYKKQPDMNSGITSFLNKAVYNAPFALIITKDEVPLNHFGNPNIIPISAKKLLLLK